MLKISTSEVSAFKECRELHRLQYVLRIRPKKYVIRSLQTGTGVHGGIEALRVDGIDAAFDKLTESDPYELAKQQAMVAGHAARWHDDGLKPLAVEQYFTLARDTYVLHGYLDEIAEDAEGKQCVVERKTTSMDLDVGSPYWATLTIDDQIGVYLPGARALGFDPQYVVYDVIRKPALEPKKKTENPRFRLDGLPYANTRLEDESIFDYRSRLIEKMCERPEQYFARKKLVRLDEEEKSHRRDLLRIVDEMSTTYDAPHIPAPKSPGACKRYGRICEYLPVCSGADTIESDNYVKEKKPKEEVEPMDVASMAGWLW